MKTYWGSGSTTPRILDVAEIKLLSLSMLKTRYLGLKLVILFLYISFVALSIERSLPFHLLTL
jgi:hypothetical protein